MIQQLVENVKQFKKIKELWQLNIIQVTGEIETKEKE